MIFCLDFFFINYKVENIEKEGKELGIIGNLYFLNEGDRVL